MNIELKFVKTLVIESVVRDTIKRGMVAMDLHGTFMCVIDRYIVHRSGASSTLSVLANNDVWDVIMRDLNGRYVGAAVVTIPLTIVVTTIPPVDEGV